MCAIVGDPTKKAKFHCGSPSVYLGALISTRHSFKCIFLHLWKDYCVQVYSNRQSHEVKNSNNKNTTAGQWHSVLTITLSNIKLCIFFEPLYLSMKNLPVSSASCNKSLACSCAAPRSAPHVFIWWAWYEWRHEQWSRLCYELSQHLNKDKTKMRKKTSISNPWDPKMHPALV